MHVIFNHVTHIIAYVFPPGLFCGLYLYVQNVLHILGLCVQNVGHINHCPWLFSSFLLLWFVFFIKIVLCIVRLFYWGHYAG